MKKKPPSAFTQGYNARKQSEPPDANPYPIWSPHYAWWLEGWKIAGKNNSHPS